MRAIPLTAVALFGLLLAPPAFASLSLGSNLGVVLANPEFGDNTVAVGVPSGAGTFPLLEPGLRIGFKGEGSAVEGYFDTGFILVSSGGATAHSLEATANFQDNFRPESDASAYLTAGAGFVNTGNSGDPYFSSTTNFLFGGGLGLWRKVGNDNGRVRVEARYDRLAGDDNAGLIGLKLGFDLWMN